MDQDKKISFDEQFVNVMKDPTAENLYELINVVFDQIVIDKKWIEEQAINLKKRLNI